MIFKLAYLDEDNKTIIGTKKINLFLIAGSFLRLCISIRIVLRRSMKYYFIFHTHLSLDGIFWCFEVDKSGKDFLVGDVNLVLDYVDKADRDDEPTT